VVNPLLKALSSQTIWPHNDKLKPQTKENWRITAYQYNREFALTFKALQGRNGAIDLFFVHCNA